MTNGVRTEGHFGGFNYASSKSWNGGDGKYQSDGKLQWNNYSMDFSHESDQIGQQDYVVSVLCADPFTWTAADDFRLQSKLVDAIKGHKFNLAVNIAQANQLVSMCEKTIRMLGRSALYLKRGNVAAAFRELGVNGKNKTLKSGDVSGRWLEMQYGWLPSIGDCFEAAKAFEAISMGRSNRVTAKTSRTWIGDASCFPDPVWGYTAPCKFFARGKIVCELEEEISFSRTLGLLDPLSVAWEIMPFSFVFDWFLPVGTYLENLGVIPSLKGRFMTSTMQGFESRMGTTTNPGFIGTKRFGNYYSLRRVVSYSLPTVRPTFVEPVTAMTWKRIANAVSLAHQLLS